MTGGDNRIYRSDERMRLQYERMLLCAALRENRDQEVETLRRPRGEEEACAAVFEKSRARMLARLNRRMLWRAFCEGMRRAAPRVARVTAAAAALLCGGLTAAFAASDAFRVQVYALFAQDYGEFTAIRAQAVPENCLLYTSLRSWQRPSATGISAWAATASCSSPPAKRRISAW